MSASRNGLVSDAVTAVAASPLRRGRPLRRELLGIYKPLDPRVYFGLAVGTLVLLFAAWWLAAALNLASDLFLPSPGQVWDRAVDLARDGSLAADVQASFIRITVGFLISTALALPIGVLMGVYRAAAATMEPPVDFIRYMPAVAFVPLTIIWAGVGDTQKYLILFIGTFFQQVLLIQDNVKRVPQEYVDVGRTLGLHDLSIVRRIIVPASAPAIWDTLRITLGWAWTWLVVAELVAADEGLGHRILVAMRYLQTDTIFLGILIIGLLGLLMDQLVRILGRRLFPWGDRRR